MLKKTKEYISFLKKLKWGKKANRKEVKKYSQREKMVSEIKILLDMIKFRRPSKR